MRESLSHFNIFRRKNMKKRMSRTIDLTHLEGRNNLLKKMNPLFATAVLFFADLLDLLRVLVTINGLLAQLAEQQTLNL